MARQRNRVRKDVQYVKVIKDENNRPNNRDPRTEVPEAVNEEVNCISREEVECTEKDEKRQSDRPDELPVEVWKCMGEMRIKFLTRLFNRLLAGERMPEEWRRSVLIPI